MSQTDDSFRQPDDKCSSEDEWMKASEHQDNDDAPQFTW